MIFINLNIFQLLIDTEESLSGTQAFLGILWAIAAFSFKNIGYVLQKAGVNKAGLDKTSENKIKLENEDVENKKITSEENRSDAKELLKTPIWWIGQGITMLGAFSLIMAYGTDAPLPLIMPFMGVGLVISIAFCRFYLKEKVTLNEWISSIIIVIGIILVTIVYEDLPAEPEQLSFYYQSYIRLPSILFFIFAIGGLVIATTWSAKNGYKYASIIFGIAAGDIGGTSLLFQSPFSKGLTLLFSGGEVVEPGFWWMFAVGVIGFAVGGVLAIVFENIGYMHGEGVLVAPLYSTFQMLFPILGGIIVFKQWKGANSITIILQSIGIIIITLGTYLLSYSNNKKKLSNIE
ncbi:MAG: DMT family transporter [Promethearchaeota archaeon]